MSAAAPEPAASLPAAELVVVRHGETTWNQEGRMQGHLDSPLNAAGVEQAEAVAARLATEAFAALYSSDLGRAFATARRIAARSGHRVVADPRLRERHLGVLQGLTRIDASRDLPDVYEGYRNGGADYVIPSGESAAQCSARVLAALEEIARRHAGERAVVVAHGGVLDVLYRAALGLPHEGPRMFTILNASVNLFRYAGGIWQLRVWGDVSHLGERALDDV
ncbi:MAG: histidine phosphatase family protein [Pseudomonadota bacterium]